MNSIGIALRFVALAAILAAPGVMAAGQRSFVASSGGDVGTCTLVAPCRSFGYAIDQTLAGGEVIALDSAGYGPVTIGKAITIAAPPGVYAGISVFSGNGITVFAGASDTVILRGLTIDGLGGTLGILIQVAATVQVERCSISGFPSGIQYNAAPGSALVVSASEFGGNGIGIQAAGSQANGRLEVVRSRFRDNYQYGISIEDVNRTTIVDSFFGHNLFGIGMQTIAGVTANPSVAIERTAIVDSSDTGVVASSSVAFQSVVNVANSTIAGNGTGLSAFSGGYLRVAGTQINGNGTGISKVAGGYVLTLGTNMLYGNGVDGTFSGSLLPN